MNIRNVYPKRIGPTALAVSATSVFTADKRYGIERVMLSNSDAADQTASLYIVASGGSPGSSNAILTDGVVPANDIMIVKYPIILDKDDQIYALASASINLTFNVNDVEVGEQ